MNKLKIMYQKGITSEDDQKAIVDHFYNQMTLYTQKNKK